MRLWTVTAITTALFAGAVLAAEVGGVRLDDKATVGGQELVLNGAGVRTRAIFKVYVGSLYLPAKADTTPESTKRISLVRATSTPVKCAASSLSPMS